MPALLELRVLELLTARLCHELIGPIAAIENGLEMIEDGPDPEAQRLVAESARRAATRLQFYRFAYGFGGEATLAGPAPGVLAEQLFDGTRISCHYPAEVRALPLASQKLCCNLLLVGAEGLSRGGRLVLEAGTAGLSLTAVGDGAALSAALRAALELATPAVDLSPRTVGAAFAALLARGLGCRLVASAAEADRFRLLAEPTAR